MLLLKRVVAATAAAAVVVWGIINPKPSTKSFIYMGGCQNYGPFLGPYYNTAPSI